MPKGNCRLQIYVRNPRSKIRDFNKGGCDLIGKAQQRPNGLDGYHYPETWFEAIGKGDAGMAGSRATIRCRHGPAAAAEDPVRAPRGTDRIDRRAGQGLIIPRVKQVLAPFPHIAIHVIKPKRVLPKLADRVGAIAGILPEPSNLIEVQLLVPEPVARRRAR